MRGIEDIRRHLRAHDLGAAYLSDPLSIGYVTGFHANPHERLFGLIVDGTQATLVVPGLEEAAARAASDVAVRAWADGSDAWEVVAACSGKGGRGLGSSRRR